MSSGALTKALAALASETPAFREGARVLTVSGDPLDAMLGEIEATVLPAALTFETPVGALSVHADGRRLVRILETDAKADPAAMGALDPNDQAAVTAVADLLAGFVRAGGELRVKSGMAPDDSGESGARLSVAALYEAMGRSVIDPDLPAAVQFRMRLSDQIKAWMTLKDGAIDETEGAGQMLASLKIAVSNQLSDFLADRFDRCPSHQDPSLTVLADVLGYDTAFGLAVFGDDIVVFALPSADIAAAYDAFRRCI